jgi:Na+/proline symporter
MRGAGGDELLRKVITWLIVLFVIFYVATEPTGAGDLVHHAYNGLHDAASSLATFVNSL